MYQNGLCKKRKAIGSIIGGAFILLIILAGFEFYILNNRAQNDYQLTLNEMRDFDIDKNQEDLKVPYIATDGDISTRGDSVTFSGDGSFTLHIRNDGPQMVTVEYIGLLIDGEEPQDTSCYQEVELNIMPTQVETYKLDVTNENQVNVTAQIQLVTNRGNVFPFEYPQDLKNYPYSYILQGAISKVIGRILPEYDSFSWGIIPSNTRIIPKMSPTWYVNYTNKDNYIFKIAVRNYGNSTITLSNKTAIYFESFGGPQEPVLSCYIASKVGDTISSYSGVTLPAYDPDLSDDPQKVTLFFASKNPGTDPFNDPFKGLNAGVKYQLKLGIFDEGGIYAQSFPLIAIEVSPKN